MGRRQISVAARVIAVTQGRAEILSASFLSLMSKLTLVSISPPNLFFHSERLLFILLYRGY